MSGPVTFITTPGGEELVLLARAEYEALVNRGESVPSPAEAPEADSVPPAGIDSNPLRLLRLEAGITLAGLAELAGVDVAIVSALESGEGIDPGICAQVAAALNVPTERILPPGAATAG